MEKRGGVGGRLKSRLAQILLRSSCSTTSATAFVSLSKNSAMAAAAPRQEPPPSPPFRTPCAAHPARPQLDRRRRRAAPMVHISIDCAGGGGSASGRGSVRSDRPLLPLPAEEERKSASKSTRYYSSRERRARRRASNSSDMKETPHLLPPGDGCGYAHSCSSSTVTDGERAPFSSDDERGEEAETRTLFSSISFSSDSTSEFYKRKPSRRRHHAPGRRRSPRTGKECAKASAGPGEFWPMASVASPEERKEDGKKKPQAAAGMAVVKRSSNPYADFRNSMVEMVVERRIGGVGGLEELLRSYLSLNSPRHRPAILAAFEDVWEAIFGED